jgi:hypothetical protein
MFVRMIQHSIFMRAIGWSVPTVMMDGDGMKHGSPLNRADATHLDLICQLVGTPTNHVVDQIESADVCVLNASLFS